MQTHCVTRVGVLVLIGFLAVPTLFGTTYTYTKITDDAPGSTLGLASFLGPFLINNSGAVAFTASSSAVGEAGIYTGSASGINTVYVGGLTVGSPVVFAATGFNDSGTVVYLTEARAVYTATAGGTPFMVSAPTSSGHSGIFAGINNAGTVAYGADVTNTSILTRTGTANAQTLVSATALPGSNALAAPSLTGLAINNSGTVALYASQVASGASCRCGIYTAGPGAPPTPVAPLQDNLSASVVPQLNDNGAVAFLGTYQGVKGVFVASNGQIAAAVDLGTQVVSLGSAINVSINSKGEIAYWAKFGISPFVEGIFTGPDKVADKVIGTGDPLFGSVVSGIAE